MAQEDLVAATEETIPKKPDVTLEVAKSGSFKEESNLVSDLHELEKKALEELKTLFRSAIASGEFSEAAADDKSGEPVTVTDSPAVPDPAPLCTTEVKDLEEDDGAKTVEAIESTVVPAAAAPPSPLPAAQAAQQEDKNASSDENSSNTKNAVFIWGVPLLEDERTDAVLLKFLRARDFKVKESFTMIKNTINWRKSFGIEKLMEEDLQTSTKLEKVVFMSGVDKEMHPVCYNVYGEFQNKELHEEVFGDGEKRKKFLRWRIQYLEKGIRELLDFGPGGICMMVQVTDLKNSPGPLKRELRMALDLLQDNYPEFVAKQIFINVPWWYIAFNKMISPFLTQRTKSKFAFAGPSKSAETLFSYISPEQVPVQFGGLSKENDPDFTTADVVSEISLKPSSKETIEFPVTEKCDVVWELRVLGWEVSLGTEFVPDSEHEYTVIVEKSKKMTANDEPVMKNSFKIGEPGKVVITVDNATSKRKKMLYRFKTMDCTEAACAC